MHKTLVYTCCNCSFCADRQDREVQDKEIYRLYSMAQRLFDLLARLQEDSVLENAVAQPIDLIIIII
jgi:hypothetical protein